MPVLVTTTRFLSWIVAILFPFDRQPEGARTRKHNQLDTLELSGSLLVPRCRKKTLAQPKILAWKMIFYFVVSHLFHFGRAFGMINASDKETIYTNLPYFMGEKHGFL